jgi:hypothetical protein
MGVREIGGGNSAPTIIVRVWESRSHDRPSVITRSK